MAINPYKAGRLAGKGVRYLTQLGSKIGEKLGSGAKKLASGIGKQVDDLGAATRNTQAATIKGARGARDAVNNAGAAAARGVKDARAGYDAGRRGNLHLSDLKPYSKPVSNFDNAGRYNTVGDMLKGVGRDNAGRVSKQKNISDGMARRASASSPGSNGKNWAVPVGKPKTKVATPEDMAAAQARADKYKNYMTKQKPKSSGGGIINKPPRPAGGVSPSDYNDWAGKHKGIVNQANKMRGNRDIYGNSTGGMSKNRRAGIITAGSIAAGYGVHRANDALQNHYQRQKNASR